MSFHYGTVVRSVSLHHGTVVRSVSLHHGTVVRSVSLHHGTGASTVSFHYGTVVRSVCQISVPSLWTASLSTLLRGPDPERQTQGSIPAWAGIFPGHHTSDSKIGTPVATVRRLAIQGQLWDWLTRCQYTVTG